MRNFLCLAFLLMVASLTSFAQTATPTPPIADDSIKISTNLIQIDVSVTDKNGNPVTDLRADEFEIFENGKRRTLSNFSYIAANGTSTPTATPVPPTPKKKDATSIPVAPIKLRQEQVRRTYALVVDDLGLNFASIERVREVLRKFIETEVRPGDLVAILRTGSGIGTMQSFTSDKRVLNAAIDRIRWNSVGRASTDLYEAIKPTLREERDGTQRADGSTVATAGVEEEKASLQQISETRSETFSIGTLGSLRYIIGGMSGLPGRKSIVLFSEGFILTDLSNRVYDQMRVIADLANRASVVFYTIDPRGVVNPEMAFADEDIRRVVPGRPGQGRFDDDPRDRRNSAFRDSQLSLRFLAAETGGLAVQNQNFFGKGLENAVNDLGSYYLLGYLPDDEVFDPSKAKFNKLEVKVARPGVKVRYRSGFFGISDEKIRSATQAAQPKVVAALISPFEQNDIEINLYPVFENDPSLGNIVQALVYIDAKSLDFTDSGSNKKANFDLLAMTFGDNGNVVDQFAKNYSVEVPELVYQNMIRNGFVYTLSVPIKKAGAYQFRVALRDTATNKVGSATQFIEIPDVTKNLSLSNLIVDGFTASEWQRVKAGGSRDNSEKSVLLDATQRRFKRNSILRFDYVIYNPDRSGTLESQVRLIRDGRIIVDEKPSAVKLSDAVDPTRIQSVGAVGLGSDLGAGSYILQVIVFDSRSPKKKITTQFVEFDVVD